jgi:peptidoglycan hydrolase-like protein with peptidoglycan-binding domain
VKAFQRQSSLEPTGVVGPETLIALYQALDYTTPRLYTAGDDS